MPGPDTDGGRDEDHDDGGMPSFARFADAWNRLQEQDTPTHHRLIAGWLAERLAGQDRNLLLMAFRGAGKSTIVGLFCAWLLLTDPNRRLLVLAADLALSKKMVRNVKRIIEHSPATQALRPKARDQWAAEQFTVLRSRELRDPSMLARGIDGNITGSRADFVICDDVEVPRTADTAPKRADLREKLSEIEFVLVPGGTQLYVGTPHSYYSLYAADARPEAGESHPFLHGFARLELPVWDEAGNPAWPERFDAAHIERVRQRSGPAKFTAQMLLKPVSLNVGRLDPDRLLSYDGELDCREAAGETVLTLNGVRLLSASCWWDPAFARPSEPGQVRDGSVITALFAGADRRLYLHRVLYLSIDPDDPTPEAQQQCRAVVGFVRDFHLPAVHVETNGLGVFLPGLLQQALDDAGLAAGVVRMSSRTPKAQRIVEAFDAPLAASLLCAHRSVFDTPFVREMREWRPGRARLPDDGLDAVAGALSCEPFRFEKPGTTARHPAAGWRPGPLVAPSDFTV